MKPFLMNLWDKIEAKLGRMASFVPMVLGEVKIKLAAGDVVGAKARLNELEEALLISVDRVRKIKERLADNILDGNETVDTLVDMEKMVDEWEDVVTGVDEDDDPGAAG